MPHDDRRDEVGDLARALARMQEELRRQEAARRAFVSTASHELRTPLTMLQGTMELLEEDIRSGRLDELDALRQVADARGSSSTASPRSSGELLDLSRLDAAVPLRSEPVELGEIVRAVAAEFELRARERSTRRSSVALPDGPCWGRGDPDAVARVVRILLDNALRYGPRGRAGARRRARRAAAQAMITVADRGRRDPAPRSATGSSSASTAAARPGAPAASASGSRSGASSRGAWAASSTSTTSRRRRHALRAHAAHARARPPSRRAPGRDRVSA